MPFYTSEQFGESLNILESEVGLVTKTKQATADMADIDGIIKAGTLFGGGDVYTPVAEPGSENPSAKGWYELVHPLRGQQPPARRHLLRKEHGSGRGRRP